MVEEIVTSFKGIKVDCKKNKHVYIKTTKKERGPSVYAQAIIEKFLGKWLFERRREHITERDIIFCRFCGKVIIL